MMSYRDGLKFNYAKLDALAALRTSVIALLGVSTEIELILNQMGILTIFDLATSPLFTTAADIVQAAEGRGNSIIARIGRVPSSFIDQDSPETPQALVLANIEMLRHISQELATRIKTHMQIENVSDLGRWMPYHSARLILETIKPRLCNTNEETNELVPTFGEYPTERHYYHSVVMDQVTSDNTIDLNDAGPIDISPTITANFGFKSPAIGAILTFAQSWFAQGLTLGNLLHSIALAPGESTRIAVLDWTRRVSATTDEKVTETETLTQEMTHHRAISEIQEAVAQEVQRGFSQTSGSATTSAGGGGFGLSLGPLTLGGSGSSAESSSYAESYSSSSGTRHLAASMTQQVSDATQQAASSVRNRRASIVKEVSEKEHESVSTRIIANYNHMHALTVQYFEVIEIYRVIVQLHQVERCLFVPMKLISFNDAMIEKYRAVLINAALTRRARELLSVEFGTVSIQPVTPMRPTRNMVDNVLNLDRIMRSNENREPRASTPNADPSTSTVIEEHAPALAALNMSIAGDLNWSKEEIFRASRITLVKVSKPGNNYLFLPRDALLTGVTFALQAQNNGPININAVQLVTPSNAIIALTALSAIDWNTPSAIPLQEISELRVNSTLATRLIGKISLQLTYNGAHFPITLSIEINPNATAQQIFRIVSNEISAELKLHLTQNNLHYSQAIWRALTPSDISLLLSSYHFEGRPVANQINPVPIRIAGNFLVFRMPAFVETMELTAEDRADDDHSPEANAYRNWRKWLNERGLVLGAQTASEQLVPVSTSGVFAEAVLGRSNSAEKLDATRFWNWQDSPIPLQPPEIAAIQMGSRSQPIDTKPGQLSTPVLNIMNPTPLPDPQGIGAVLNAVQNGNMFRDMAGLAATTSFAQGLSGNATTAGTEAAKLAAANLSVAAQKDIEEKRIAAQLAMAALGLPNASAGSAKNISENGALLNTAKEMDNNQGASSVGTQESADGLVNDGEFDSSYMPSVGEEMKPMRGESRADEVLSKMTWGSLGSRLMPAAIDTRKSRPVITTIYFELAIYANFPRPWADEAREVDALVAKKWLPSSDDFDAISTTATSSQGGTKPNSLITNSLNDMIFSINYFAPRVSGFGNSFPARVSRVNLFLYAEKTKLELLGTLKTNGTWTSTYDRSLGIKASVLDVKLLEDILADTASQATLAALRNAWVPGAEIWLYTSGDVPNDALAQCFARLMGATVKAFTEPFWVLPRYGATGKTIYSRNEFGIGTDFSAATYNRTDKLHTLDSLATRRFSP